MNRTQILLESVPFRPYSDNMPDCEMALGIYQLTEFLKYFEKLASAVEKKFKSDKDELFVWHLTFFGSKYDGEESMSLFFSLRAKVALVDITTRKEISSYPNEITITHGLGDESGSVGCMIDNGNKSIFDLQKIISLIVRSLKRKRQ